MNPAFRGGTQDCLVGVYSFKKNNLLIHNNFDKFYDNIDPISYPIRVLGGANGDHTNLLLRVTDYTLTNSKGKYKSIGPCNLKFNTLSPKTIKWELEVTEEEFLFTDPVDRFTTESLNMSKKPDKSQTKPTISSDCRFVIFNLSVIIVKKWS